MGDESRKLTGHDEIKSWAQQHGAKPAMATATASEGEGVGVLRLSFGRNTEGLEEITWETWFETFEQKGLALLVSDDGGSNFNKLVAR